MDDKIRIRHVLVAMLIGFSCIFMGTIKGRQEREVLPNVIIEPPTTEWETVTMTVTAYCPCELCCDDWGKILVSSGERKTASKHTIKEGDKFVAAPRKYPFGTEMIIEGYADGKIVKVEDIGGAIKGNKLDVYFDDHQEALNWGVRDIEVKVRIKK